MTLLPQVRSAMVEAMDQGPRRVRGRRLGRSVLAVASAAALIAIVVSVATVPDREREVPPAQSRQLDVPAATLEQSRALTRAPLDSGDGAPPVPASEVVALAAAYGRDTPYPPEDADAFDWSGVGAMERWKVHQLVEARAACLWLGFWLDASAAGDTAALGAAVGVLRDVSDWPTMRAASTRWGQSADLAAAGDVAAVEARNRQDCTPLPQP